MCAAERGLRRVLHWLDVFAVARSRGIRVKLIYWEMTISEVLASATVGVEINGIASGKL